MKRFQILIAVLLVMTVAAQSLALTRAGTKISNYATGNYKDANGNSLTAVNSNTVETTVTQVGGVDISPATDSNNMRRNGSVDYALTVTNTGNDFDTFNLSAAITSSSGSGTYSYKIYFDSNGDGSSSGESEVSATSSLDMNDTYDLVVNVAVSGGSSNGDDVEVTVTAESQYDNTETDASVLTSTIAAAVLDGDLGVDNQSKQPSETITYTMTVSELGTQTAYNTLVTLTVPTNTAAVANSVKVGGVDKTDSNADADGVEWTGTQWLVDLGDVANGASDIEITYQVTVDAGVSANTSINTTDYIDYEDLSGSSYTQVTVSTDASSVVTVGQEYGVSTTIVDNTMEGDPGDNVTYEITVQNDGNGDDSFNLSTSGGSGWTWTFYLDADDDGNPDGGAVTSTGNVTSGSTMKILAVATIPSSGLTDGQDETVSVVATSAGDASESDSESTTTTVTMPDLGLVKSASTGTAAPGDDITYTIVVTNNGSGDATSVVITDNIPTNSTYKTGTLYIDWNGGSGDESMTDGSGDDEASCDGSTATFNLGGMAAGDSYTVKLTVTVD